MFASTKDRSRSTSTRTGGATRRTRRDADLQAAHAAHPWIVTWDDHEVDNNYAADLAQRDQQTPADFLVRRAAAYQAWWEHQPVRLPAPTGPDYRIYRRLALGDLATLHVLDTRQYRSNQPCGSPVDIGCRAPTQDAPDATLLGADAEASGSSAACDGRVLAGTWSRSR